MLLMTGQHYFISGLTNTMPRNFHRKLIVLNPVAFSPTDITGLQLWLDANDASTLFQDAAKTTAAGVSDVVGGWADKSAQGNDATQGTTSKKPIVSAAVIGGLNTVLGDSDDEMVISVGTLTNETIFAVVKRVDTASGSAIITVDANTRLFFPAAGTIRYRFNATNAVVAGVTDTDPNIYRARYDGANITMSVNNGTPTSTAAASLVHTWDTIMSELGTAFLKGHLAEIIVYDNALSVGNVALIENYLSNKWSITIA